MREIPKAILATKQSLSINPSHVPSWHLLVLLLSSQKDHEKALSICSAGLRESVWDQGQTDDASTSGLDGEEYMALRITQATLHDKVHGPESALEHQGALFSLYSRVFATDPSTMSESLYAVQPIRRQSQSQTEIAPTPVVTGRPRANSSLSVKSRNGDRSDLVSSSNGSYLNASTLGKQLVHMPALSISTGCNVYILQCLPQSMFVPMTQTSQSLTTRRRSLPRLDQLTPNSVVDLLPQYRQCLVLVLWADLWSIYHSQRNAERPNLSCAQPERRKFWSLYGSCLHPYSDVLGR
jgi:hypothetical protein